MPDSFKVSPLISTFCIYNTSRKLQENAEAAAKEQICYYYPLNTPVNDRVKRVGVAQAITAFSLTFPVSSPCDIVTTKKSRWVIKLVEPPDFWIMMKIRLGAQIKVEKDNRKLADYMDYELGNSLVEQIVLRAYKRFTLFYGSFVRIESRPDFTDILDSFFSNYIDGIYLNEMDVLSSFNSLYRMPLDKSIALSTVCFIKQFESTFKLVNSMSCLFYKHYLLWNGLSDIDDVLSVYDYITDPETGKIDDLMINQVKMKGEPVVSSRPSCLAHLFTDKLNLAGHSEHSSASHALKPSFAADKQESSDTGLFSGFLVGPAEADDEAIGGSPLDFKRTCRLKRVYLGTNKDPYGLIVYQFQNDLTAVFFVDVNSEDAELLSELGVYVRMKEFMQAALYPILKRLQDIEKQTLKKNEPDSIYRYLSFNTKTLAIKTSISPSKQIPIDVTTLLGQLNEDLKSDALGIQEIIIKCEHFWVVATVVEDTKLFLIVHKQDLSLSSISDEIEKFKSTFVSSYSHR